MTLCNDPCCSPRVTSLQSQLDAMKLNKLHAATMAPAPRTRDEKAEVRPHPRASRRQSLEDNRPRTANPENRITTIPEITESFEKRLQLSDKRTMSLVSITARTKFTDFYCLSLTGCL